MPNLQEQINQLNIERSALQMANDELRNQIVISRSKMKLYEQQIENERLSQILKTELMRDNQIKFEAAGKKLVALIIKTKS